MRQILGIHDGHNASVALFGDGKILYAIQEERLVREKNKGGFPTRALEHVLSRFDLKPADIGHVGMSSHFQDRHYNLPLDLHLTRVYRRSPLAQLKRKLTQLGWYKAYRTALTKRERSKMIEEMGFRRDCVTFVGHHQAHAAMAYFGMRQDEGDYLVLTLDGSGDWLCSTVSRACGGKMTRLAQTTDHHSLGYMYATVTRLLGFRPLEDEYKLMGMAGYCSEAAQARASAVFSRYLGIDPANSLCFRKKTRIPAPFLGPYLEKDLAGMRFDHICGGLQLFTERLILDWVRGCIRECGLKRLILGGGVFMNVKANKLIMELPEIEWLAVSPSCGDETLSLGACYEVASESGDKIQRLENFYLGDEVTERDCEKAVNGSAGFTVERPANLALRIAELLAQGQVVARAGGRMEFGARALGNRSIFADPSNADVVRVINHMIKRRDFWMPFAPVALKRNVEELCVNPLRLASPYMMLAFDTVEGARPDLRAAIHPADLTARLQIVEPGSNRELEAILEAFEKKTGRKALLNTSFNLHGYPIVCAAEDALAVFRESGLQCLALGPFLIQKR